MFFSLFWCLVDVCSGETIGAKQRAELQDAGQIESPSWLDSSVLWACIKLGGSVESNPIAAAHDGASAELQQKERLGELLRGAP